MAKTKSVKLFFLLVLVGYLATILWYQDELFQRYSTMKVPKLQTLVLWQAMTNESNFIINLRSYPIVSLPVQYKGDMENSDGMPNHTTKEVHLSKMIVPTATNATPSDARLMIYNRVPKCGSTTFKTILQRNAQNNSFYYEYSTIYQRHWVQPEEQRTLMKRLYKESRNKFYSIDRHMYFFNVIRLGFPKVIWINMVRDPVARFVSWYYFIRNRMRWNTEQILRNTTLPPDWWFDTTLDDCIQARRPECFPDSQGEIHQTSMQLTFFCGHHQECLAHGSFQALQRAKYNAENHYSVVGIIEELSLSMDVFKQYIPRYFYTKKKTKLDLGEVKENERPNFLRKQVSNTTKEVIRSFLKEDIEFYEFLHQRLHLQAASLNITGL